MKVLWSFALLMLPTFAVSAASRVSEPAIIPAPAHIELQRGAFVIDRQALLNVSDDPQALAVAHYFGDLLLRTRGIRTEIGPLAASGSSRKLMQFTLSGAGAIVDPEGYELTITPDGVALTASDARGLFYGATTLWQILTLADAPAESARAPALTIVDAPRLKRRGLMLDSTAQFQSVEFIKRFIDAMALHKLNVLQWRLAGDAAWRLEIPKHPRLTSAAGGAVGARRFYNRSDVRAIVEHAASRHVTIVPAVEMPAHATAAIAAYPDLGARTGAPGDAPHLLNIDEATFSFIRDVLDETTASFPGTHVYLGGETAADWAASPKVQARMRELGLVDAIELQRYFTSRVASMLKERQRTLTGMDGVMIGGPSDATLVVASRGLDSALGASAAGYDVVVSSLTDLDLSLRQASTPTAGERLLSAQDVYSFDPSPAALSDLDRNRLIGVQANLWTQAVASDAELEEMAFPRAAALAEAAWSPPARLSWSSFQQRLPAQMARYRMLGLRYSDAVFQPTIIVRDTPQANRAVVEISKQAALGEIRYTVNGGDPTASSTAYSDLFEIKTPAVIRAAAFHEGAPLTAPATLMIGEGVTAKRN